MRGKQTDATVVVLLVAFLFFIPASFGATSVTNGAITWTFDGDYQTGQYANGDWWVLGPVTITRISPDFDGSSNGWEVNPIQNRQQGFDSQCGDFFPSLIPELPYLAQPGDSIVKGVDSGVVRPACLQSAAVLTVVGTVPPGNGALVFRPPYVGTSKPNYYVNDLRLDLLPSLNPVDNAPSLDWVYNRFKPVQLDHGQHAMGRYIHPIDHMPDYAPDMARDADDAALRLMLNDPVADKMPALIVYVQYGIDLYYTVLSSGTGWTSGGGYTPGKKLPLAFAAVMLDDQNMKNWLLSHDNIFNEDAGTYYNANGIALFGFDPSHPDYGTKTARDPLQMIDGGGWVNGMTDLVPGTAYQFCCLSQPWKGSALAALLMPEIKAVWQNQDFFDYVDRWVDFGTWTLPDPQNRYPSLHGNTPDGGYRRSAFQGSMWDAYRATAGTDVCSNGATRSCGSGVGACSAGTQTCSSGQWGACVGAIGPVTEVCTNGIDDDCDGAVDASDSDCLSCACTGASCQSGNTGLVCDGCNFVTAPSESCTNNIDDDCDGTIDCDDTDCNNNPVCATVNPPSTFPVNTIFEAEDGVLVPPMVAASGYVASSVAESGAVSYTFNITTPGTYYLETSVVTPGTNPSGHDSFYVGLDGEPASGDDVYSFDTVHSSSVFIWDNVSRRGLGSDVVNEFDPMVWNLSMGLHTFTFYGRETNTRIDQVILKQIDSSPDCACSGNLCAEGILGMICDGCHYVSASSEICSNNIDDNCNGQVDEGCASVFSPDIDGDGDVDMDDFVLFRGGYRTTYSFLDLLLFGREFDSSSTPVCVDGDGDGFGVDCALGPDCDDADASIHPSAPEICADDKDNDCDNSIDCSDNDCSFDASCFSCSCETWVDAGCGTGTCAATDLQQIRGCTPTGCQSETRCLPDVSCSSPPQDNCADADVLCVGSGQEYSTIQSAVNNALLGQHVVVYPGTYAEQVTTVRSGTAANRIIISASDLNNKPVMRGFNINHAYITVDGFEITSTQIANGITIDGNNVIVSNNFIHDILDRGIVSNGNNNILRNNYILRSNAGIWVSGSGTLVENNEVERLMEYGNRDADYSRFFGSDHIFRNNYYHGTILSDMIKDSHVDCWQTFDVNNEPSINILIEGNTCFSFHQALMASANTLRQTRDIVIRGNTFAHGRNGVIARDGPSYITVVGNTFSDLLYYAVWFYGGNTHSVIKNNIVDHSGSGIVVAADSSAIVDYNLIFQSPHPSPAPGVHDLLDVNPLFINIAADEYGLQTSSPACGAGEGGSDIGAVACN